MHDLNIAFTIIGYSVVQVHQFCDNPLEAALVYDYYRSREKNVRLAPILIVLSIVFGVGMAVLHAFAGKA